jgi:hypothetical protein
MGAIVVYESMFGNTEAVARAVAEGIASVMPVELIEVNSAPPLATMSTDLLVVGGPTHAFGLSRPNTRADAKQRGARDEASTGQGIREWLEATESAPLRVATFDTHVKKPNLPGRASHAAERRLHRMGCEILTKGMSFYVDGYDGPMYPGEVERAREWGAEVAQLAVTGAAQR